MVKLYYIVSLHQTTTEQDGDQGVQGLYYIVSLHQTTTAECLPIIVELLYYIVSLHQTTTHLPVGGCELRCIISFLYIKPQQ